jgi:DNA-binding transcriptional LysR family regulator
MDRFTAMQVFAEVADRGSLTDTARALEMSRAMVSRYVASLEDWLGVRLLHRTTRRVSLTDAGVEALERCRQVLDLTHDVKAVAGVRRSAPSGRLRITTSTSFAQAHLASAVADFLILHPQTQIELIALERTVNLVEERIDLAVRITNRLDATHVARRLGVCRSVLCAAPAYIARHGMPTSPDDLRTHRCVTHAYFGRTEVRLLRGGQTVRVPVNGPLQSNETTVLLQATLAGAGIALLPTYLASAQLVQGRLVHLLPEYEPEALGIHATYLSRQHQPQLLRVMLDFLTARFGDDVAPWDRDIAALESTSAESVTRRRPRPKRASPTARRR